MLRLANQYSKHQRFFTTALNNSTARNNIDIAFNPDKADMENIDKLSSEARFIRDQIRSAKENIDALVNRYNHIQDSLQKLNEPLEIYASKQFEIGQIANMILDGINESILNDRKETKHGPSYGFDKTILSFFEPIFNAYGITFGISESISQRETAEYLHLNFPNLPVSKINFPVHENQNYNSWVRMFLNAVNSKISSANDTVETDYLLLERQLYRRINEGADNAFVKFKPCLAAVNRFKQLTADQGLQLSVHDDIVTLERKEKPRDSCFVR